MQTDTEVFTPVVFLHREDNVAPPPPPSPLDTNTDFKGTESLNEEEAKNLKGEIQSMKQNLENTNAQLETAKQQENFLEADRLKRSYEEIQNTIPLMEKQLSTGIENHKRMRFQALIRSNGELSAAVARKSSRERVKQKVASLVQEHKEDLTNALEYFNVL